MAGVYLHPGTHAPTTPPSHSKPFHAIRGHSVPFLSSSALANQKPNPFAARQPGILAVSWCQDCCNEKKKQGGGGAAAASWSLLLLALFLLRRHGFTFMHMQFFIFLPYILPGTNLFAAAIPIPRCQDEGRRTMVLRLLLRLQLWLMLRLRWGMAFGLKWNTGFQFVIRFKEPDRKQKPLILRCCTSISYTATAPPPLSTAH